MVFKVLIQSKFVQFNCTIAARVFCTSSANGIAAKTLQTGTPSSPAEKIVVPLRVKRDELSILKALSSTVKLDHRSPHLKFIDDPFLIPGSIMEKRTYSLAKASGQKAARYVVERYPDNFANDPAQPPITVLMPPQKITSSVDSLEGLRDRIAAHEPLESYESYQKLRETGVSIPEEDVENLLDLLCFFNSEKPVESLLSEELFFLRDMNSESGKKKRKDWKDDGAAEDVYKGLELPSVRASCTLIRGRAKFYQADGAHSLFKELRQQNIKVDVKTYNALLDVAFFLRDSAEKRWELILEILKDMAEAGVQPDVCTFNTVLGVLARCNRYTKVSLWSKLVLNEMQNCHIEPTLTTWGHLLHTNYGSNESSSPVLYRIIEHLEGKKLALHQLSDYDFFSVAMAICFTNFKDLKLAYKIKELVDVDDNRTLLGDNFRQGVYYTYFLRLLCLCEQLDNIMLHYDKVVPHLYTPTYSVLNELLTALELNEGYQYLPRLWSDLVFFKYTRRSDLVEQLLSIMGKKKQPLELQEHFVKIASNIQQLHETDSQDRKATVSLVLSGTMIGHLIQIHLYANNFSQAWDLLQFYRRDQRKISGFPSEQSLVNMAEVCVRQQDVSKTLEVLSLMSDFGYPKLDEIASKVKDSMTLTDHQRSHLDDLL